jgi:CBS domain-containing protein
MLVREIMTHGVECVGPEETLSTAAEKMKSLDVGALPVCENDRLVGMVTDRDITIRATASGTEPEACVRDSMTPGVTYCFEDEDVAAAARLMREKQIRRIVVLNRDKRMVGIVSLGDVAIETGDDQMSGNTLEAVSDPNRPNR